MTVEELLRWAAACAASGDSAGEVEAYRKADEQGDAEAAILLGNALRRAGATQEATEAYRRAEERGHREAGMSLGNLLDDLGDVEGAKSAYLRSIALGSSIAALNLGLLLAARGALVEALEYLAGPAAEGDSHAMWATGRIHADLGNVAAALAAYQQGVDRGDPECAHAMGVLLYGRGDIAAAKSAFEKAAALGHSGASEVLAAFEAETPSTAGPTPSQLWGEVTAVFAGLVSNRQELGRSWIAASGIVTEKQGAVAALTNAQRDVQQRLATVTGRFKTQPELGRHAPPHENASPSHWLNGQRALDARHSSALDEDLREASSCLAQAETKTFGGGLRSRGAQALGRVAQRLQGLEAALATASRELQDAEASRTVAAGDALAKARTAFQPVLELASAAAGQLPTIMQPWSSSTWQSWTPEDTSNRGLRLAYGGVLVPKPDERLGPNAGFGSDVRVPWGITLHESWFVSHEGNARAAAHGFVRSVLLRQLLSVAPGEVQFCIFDPVGLGQSAGDLLNLAEYDPNLIGGKVWSSAQDLEARLVELSDHIELVIQKYLRTTYNTIDEFNDAAGEVAEPYRQVVLFDCPTGLTAESAARLRSIVENGPRCGVFTLIVNNNETAAPYGVEMSQVTSSMRRLHLQSGFSDDIQGYRLETTFEHDVLPERHDVARRIIEGVGRASMNRTDAAITFDKVFRLFSDYAGQGRNQSLGAAAAQTRAGDPASWWQCDSTPGIFAPIGQKGARDVAVLGFDSSDYAGGLLVGRPGSGKSTLMHAFLAGLTTLYGPDELELYLIDFKEGVEFKTYAEERLPHAKVIAIESDREFGVSVLQSLQAEITRRADLLRSTGGRQSGVRGLREATGAKIPRILLVFDEFQVLFRQNDKVGLNAADLLESIIRQGRGFGVHVLLGSQSLSGLDALGAHVPQLLPVRILLSATEADAQRMLGDGNNAGEYLTRRGEGVLNMSGGAVAANERFNGALLEEADRVARLQVLRDKADNAGFHQNPMVFEGNALMSLHGQEPERFREETAVTGTSPLRLRTGAAMTVGELGDLTLARESGANVLAVVRGAPDDANDGGATAQPAYGLLVASVTSAAMSEAAVDVIDFMSNDDGLDLMLEPLLNAQRISLRRRRAFVDLLNEYDTEVTERLDADDTRRRGRVLFLFGIHRARDLDSELGSLDVDGDLVEKLERVMRDGPEVGIHVWMWADSVAGASRRLTPRMMRETGWRIAGRMSTDDSHSFISTGQAGDLRDSQLLLTNEDRGISTRLTCFSPPAQTWVAQLVAASLRD